MLKGVNRQVVEIPQPDSAYFEKVIFFVKPGCSAVSETKLRAKADELIKDASTPPQEKNMRRTSSRLMQAVKFSIAAASGAIVSAIGFFLSNL